MFIHLGAWLISVWNIFEQLHVSLARCIIIVDVQLESVTLICFIQVNGARIGFESTGDGCIHRLLEIIFLEAEPFSGFCVFISCPENKCENDSRENQEETGNIDSSTGWQSYQHRAKDDES